MQIIKITGGLGNQMFQYAFAKTIENSITQNNENNQVLLDITAYNGRKELDGINLVHNGFELSRIFNISYTAATRKMINKLSTQPTSLISRIRRKYFTKKTHYIDTTFNYKSQIIEKSKTLLDRYYDGYWQSEKYFENIADNIRSDFTFKLPLSEKSSELLKTNVNRNLASLHIRRGDYLNSPNLNVCSETYYKNALKKLCELSVPEVIFVFSDDIPWCKNQLKIEDYMGAILNSKTTIPEVIYIDWNKGQDSWQDMALMSKCNSHIIANSSFSWWGAWLDNSPNKVVIAPKVWNMRELHDNDKYYKHNYADIVPSSWLRAEVF